MEHVKGLYYSKQLLIQIYIFTEIYPITKQMIIYWVLSLVYLTFVKIFLLILAFFIWSLFFSRAVQVVYI